MPIIIDPLNLTETTDEIISASSAGTLRFKSKLYAKYLAKSLANGIILGTAAGLIVVGAVATVLVVASVTLTEEESE